MLFDGSYLGIELVHFLLVCLFVFITFPLMNGERLESFIDLINLCLFVWFPGSGLVVKNQRDRHDLRRGEKRGYSEEVATFSSLLHTIRTSRFGEFLI